MPLSRRVITVDLAEAQLRLWEGAELCRTYAYSWSMRPPSCRENSLGTPWGLHVVARKIGAGAPAGTVFTARVDTGRCWDERTDRGPEQPNLVTTRILWLRGCEPGLNAGEGCDSFARYIYLHGTNRQDRIPERLSAGCLLLGDADLIDLFDLVEVGTLVWIADPPGWRGG